MLLIGAVSSCGLSEIGKVHQDDGSGSIWGGPMDGSGSIGGLLESVRYLVAVDYPKGYDWRADQARENVKCSLVVYVEDSPVMKVPVSLSYQVASDADMHRMAGGNLYTDYCNDYETFIKKNGKSLFAYQGAECLWSLVLCGDDVFTLGENRSGSGFSMRKNGNVVISRERASVIAPLRADGDSLCFGFCEQILNADGKLDRYYSVYGSKVTNLSLRGDVQKVWDVFTENGKEVFLASLQGVAAPVIVSGEEMRALKVPQGQNMISCSMFNVGDKIGVEGVCSTSAGKLKAGIWVDGNLLIQFDNANLVSICTDGEGICCVLNPVDEKSSGIIYRCGEIYEMPEGYLCMGPQCLAMVNGILNVGLSSQKGQRPLLWKDGQTDTLKINGYISGIWSQY